MADMERNFYRCPDCLAVVAIDSPKVARPIGTMHWSQVQHAAAPRVACAVCQVDLEHMGRVHVDRLVKDTERDACDHRCLGARGPKCSCSCEGDNHGAGLLVIVSTADAGAVPTAHPIEADKALVAGDAWRALKAASKDAIAAVYPELAQKARGEYVTAWGRYLDARDLMRRRAAIIAQRSPARVKALQRLMDGLSGSMAA